MAAIALPRRYGDGRRLRHKRLEPERPRQPAAKSEVASAIFTPIAVLLLAARFDPHLTRNWNCWEGGEVDQVKMSYVRGDITPLSTRFPAIVSRIHVRIISKCTRGTCSSNWKTKTTRHRADQENRP